ncbi:sialate O-acetylesterase [Hydrotalea sp.]|uniref:sialate O-acetylesterase n=1 Tax=Hydrotalea sp. TaxID=2881279 RepID=UPI0025889331|nr:sialate O-acetylesterase [Hydrotalea sp.]
MKRFCAFVVIMFFGSAKANIILPSILNNNMVLQQRLAVTLWGWGNPGEVVKVTNTWNNAIDSATTNANAHWQLTIQTPAVGGPYQINFKGYNSITLTNVFIGEVWLCSGQSNMEMNEQWGLPDVKAVLPHACNPNIRFFTVAKSAANCPQQDVKGTWVSCDAANLQTFSAAAYFFGKKLQDSLHVPIALINASWGGTPAEVWTPDSIIRMDEELLMAAKKQKPSKFWPHEPGVAFNAMIAPIARFAIAGAIWYQGETNTAYPYTYAKLFTEMMGTWRKAWKYNFSFYYVQIAPFAYGKPYAGALLQEQQSKAAAYPNVGMVVITDLVTDTSNIHPKNKHDVGDRLANWALAKNYEWKHITCQSPHLKNVIINSDKVLLSFEDTGGGLLIKGANVQQIWVAGADKVFYPAAANIEGNQLMVWSSKVQHPIAVRYAFGNTAIGNLFGSNHLPVIAFRTDNWKLNAANNK